MLRAKQLRSRLATHFPCHTPRSQAPYPGVIGPSRETPVSAPGTPEAAPEFGGSGRHSRWWARAALRGLAPKCAASSSSQPGWCPSSPAEGAERLRRPPTSPLLLGVPSLHSSANALCVCQRGSPHSLTRPRVCRSRPPPTQREGRPFGAPLRAHPGLDNFLMGLETPGSRSLRDLQTADPGGVGRGEANARPGRDPPRAKVVGARQGCTALNVLDSPAPALSPPSSADSWGLCFLHPFSRPRSASTDSRDSPSATVRVHSGEPPWRRLFPGCRVQVETPAGEGTHRYEVVR